METLKKLKLFMKAWPGCEEYISCVKNKCYRIYGDFEFYCMLISKFGLNEPHARTSLSFESENDGFCFSWCEEDIILAIYRKGRNKLGRKEKKEGKYKWQIK